MPDPNESAEDLAERLAAIEEAREVCDGPDKSLGEDVRIPASDAIGVCNPCQDKGAGYAHGEVPDESLSEDRNEAQPEERVTWPSVPQDDPYRALHAFLLEFDPALNGCDFNPAEVAMARLGTQKTYLDRFMVQAGEFRQAAEEQLNEVARLQADLALARDAAAQKDVRDERIGAIQALLKAKASAASTVARIQQLLS